jgi:DNA-binding transcriptional LysR family regulator
MDWDNIRFFLGVARARQFSAAAARMGVDTATVGRRINALEKSLNVRLVDRQRTGCALTTEGERFLQTAERLESQILQAQGGTRKLSIRWEARAQRLRHARTSRSCRASQPASEKDLVDTEGQARRPGSLAV